MDTGRGMNLSLVAATRSPNARIPKAKKAKTKYYAVAQGKTPGIYQTWDEAMEQIRGFTNARHRSFKAKHQAEQYLLENGVGVSAVATRASRRIAGLPAQGFTVKKKSKTPAKHPAPRPRPEPSDASFSPSPSTSATPELSARSVDEAQDRSMSSRASTPHSGAPDIVDALVSSVLRFTPSGPSSWQESLLRLQELTADALRAFGRDDGMQPLSAGMMAKDEAMGVLRSVRDAVARENRVLQAVCAEPAPAPRPPEKYPPAAPSTPADEYSADVLFLSLYES